MCRTTFTAACSEHSLQTLFLAYISSIWEWMGNYDSSGIWDKMIKYYSGRIWDGMGKHHYDGIWDKMG